MAGYGDVCVVVVCGMVEGAIGSYGGGASSSSARVLYVVCRDVIEGGVGLVNERRVNPGSVSSGTVVANDVNSCLSLSALL